LIGSGGVNSGFDAAKAFALGADIVASARKILITLNKYKVEGVINLVKDWFEMVRKIMYLTGSSTLRELRKNKLIEKENLC